MFMLSDGCSVITTLKIDHWWDLFKVLYYDNQWCLLVAVHLIRVFYCHFVLLCWVIRVDNYVAYSCIPLHVHCSGGSIQRYVGRRIVHTLVPRRNVVTWQARRNVFLTNYRDCSCSYKLLTRELLRLLTWLKALDGTAVKVRDLFVLHILTKLDLLQRINNINYRQYWKMYDIL